MQMAIEHMKRWSTLPIITEKQNHNEVPPHTIKNGHHQKVQKQFLERVWRKGNALALLVGMLMDAATMEDGMEIPLKKVGI